MAELSQIPISALVVVTGRNKLKIEGHTEITSKNAGEYSFDEKTISELSKIFSDRGFDVGAGVGISISVTASKNIFENFLGVSIYREDDGAYGFLMKGKKLGIELKNEFLPEIIRDKVQSITFTLPPDFGPTNW